MPLDYLDSCPSFILLDDATPNGISRLYQSLQKIDQIKDQTNIYELDQLLNKGWQQGLHVVLFAPYEFATPLEQRAKNNNSPRTSDTGFLQLFWFASLQKLSAKQSEAWLAKQDVSEAPALITNLHSNVERDAYFQAISDIKKLIAAGDTYQVNFTYRLLCKMIGDPLHLYRDLRKAQPVPYGVLACLPNDEWVLSLSPELFVRHDGEGYLLAQPMKGTAKISGDIKKDQKAALALAQDNKNRAENLMIVDLLRNDIGKIAKTGSVEVSDLFQVSPFGRVLQMTSKVSGKIPNTLSYADLFGALFPCGSITGAPKKRTMEIIQQIEVSPRGLYTGAIGWLDPANKNNELGAFCFSVVIRTLLLSEPDKFMQRNGELGIGSGIVADSVANDEYLECAWKSRFLREHNPNFLLFETMRLENGKCALLNQHLSRLSRAALDLDFSFDFEQAQHLLQNKIAQLDAKKIWRLKLSLAKNGELNLQSALLSNLPDGLLVASLVDEPLTILSPLRFYKITARDIYDNAWKNAEKIGAFDALFFNEQDELLEGGRTNVFVKISGRWITPPIELGVLPGVMRQEILDHPIKYLDAPVMEARIKRQDINKAEAIVLSNALRGILPIKLIGKN